MSTTVLKPAATVAVPGIFTARTVTSGEVALDAMGVPYATATLELPLVDQSLIESLNPRQALRASVVMADAAAGTSRTFDLSVQSRSVMHDRSTLQLGLASDEALLQQYYPLVDDKGALAHQASLRAVCNYVLGKIPDLAPGTALAIAPGVDADATAYWQVTNLLTEPGHEGSLGWVAGANATALGPATPAHSGAAAARWTAVAAGESWIDTTGPIAVTQGRLYTISTYMRSTTSAVRGGFMVRFRNEADVVIREAYSDAIVLATTYQRVTASFLAPPGATKCTLHIGMQADAAGRQCWNDDAMFYEGGEEIPFFDGDTPDDANYTYSWSGTPQASTSTRVPIIERPLELFTWRPNTSAWAFLMTLVAAFGFRLFCDENRVWRLVDPVSYLRPGIVLAGVETGDGPTNATAGEDTIDRADDTWCTGVCIQYRWQDRWGIEQVRYDTAGVAGRVRYLELDRPFPGAGLAAALLNRAVDQGRSQSVTALADVTATPGMTLAVTLPGTRPQRATLTSVSWDLVQALMTVTGDNAKTVPGQPAAPTVAQVGADLVVTWTAPNDGGSPITGYTVVIGRADIQAGDAIPVAGSPLVIPVPPNPYLIAVYAKNANGNGPTSPFVPFTVT